MTGPVAVVDVDHGDSGRAGIQHGEQRRQPFEGSPVADRGRHRDHRCRHQPGHHTRQRAVHPRGDDDGLGGSQPGQLGEDPVQTGHPDIHHDLCLATEIARGQQRLASHRYVGGAGGQHQHRAT